MKKSSDIQHNVASVPPSLTDDVSKGYSSTSNWVDLVGLKIYEAISTAVGAAVWVEISGGGVTDIQNTIFVTTNGSTTDSRVDVVGNIFKPVTPERAAAIMVAGDTAIVAVGEYTVVPVAANGLSVDGANWHFARGANFNQSSGTGMFSNAGFSTGCKISGEGGFYGTSTAPTMFTHHRSFEWEVEGYECTHTSSRCFYNITSTATEINIRFTKKILSTGSEALRVYGGTLTLDCPIIQSTSADTIIRYVATQTTIISESILATGAFNSLDFTTNGGNLSIVASFVTKASFAGTGYISYNVGETTTISTSVVNLDCNGYVETLTHLGGNADVALLRHLNSTGTGKVNATVRNVSGDIVVSNQYASEVNLYPDKVGLIYNNAPKTFYVEDSGANLHLRGDWAWYRNVFHVSEGQLTIHDKYETASINGGFNTFNLTGTGKIFVKGTMEEKSTSKTATMFECAVDGLILDGATLIVADQDQHLIRYNAGIGNVKVKGNVSTNLVGFNSAKAQKLEFYFVNDSVFTSLTINGEVFTPTIDTIANMVAQVISDINLNGVVDVSATNGSAADRVEIESLTAGNEITISYGGNSGIWDNFRENTKGFNLLLGGTVTEDVNITE